jgi:pimeloyl-ACP methyl ester carboxylesterase
MEWSGMAETTRQFGSAQHLVGTFAEPDATGSPPAGVMVLLTNAGLISRSGPNRMNVRLARHFAAVGIPSLRFDMSGLGDSGRPSTPLPLREQAIEDTRAAMDEAQRMYGLSRFVMIGFCSGAEAAYTTALQDERLVGLVLFDLFTYPTWKTHLIRLRNRIRRFGFLSAMRRLARAIMRHLTGKLPRLLPAREANSPSSTPSRGEFAARLDGLHSRGTRVLILHSVESEMYNYAEQFRDCFGRFGIIGKVDYMYLQECNHVFTTPEAQRSLVATAVEWVVRLPSPATSGQGGVASKGGTQGEIQR